MTHRFFIDEVGNGDLKGAQNDDNIRYLSLTGIITSRSHHDTVMHSDLEALKIRYFPLHTAASPIILHRREIRDQKGPFAPLKDPIVRGQFDETLLDLLRAWQFTAITVTIDKREHLSRYNVWRYDPYHYCLHCLVERYVLWLNRRGLRGDVVIEARNKGPDKRLKKSYRRLYEEGTWFLKVADAQRALTSHEIKIAEKKKNLAGLQIADLIAHPSFRAMRHQRDEIQPPVDFGTRVVEILELTKLDRHPTRNTIPGYGRKWLPT